ncbi:MAG: prephenate dehydrogenase/arogenate dehydrogenase family protein [Anaerolineae bacterium]
MQAQNITFIGLTRASLSFALAVKDGAPGLNLVGFDTDSALVDRAVEKKIIDSGQLDLEKALSKADIIVIDAGPAETANIFGLMANTIQEHVVITHLSPKSQSYQKLADKLLSHGFYVGSAPVQSVHTFGTAPADPVEAATIDLFRKSLFCLMPSAKVDEGAVATVRALGQLAGAIPFFIDPFEYDTYMQALDLLPQISHLALFEALHTQTAWKDMTRLAGNRFAEGTAGFADKGDTIAQEIYSDKTSAVHWINQYIAALEEIKRWVEVADEQTVGELINERSFKRDIWLQTRKDNQWDESQATQVKKEGLRDMFMGNLLGRRRKNKE